MHLDASRGLAMGHTRLSIIDLDTGSQPLRDRSAVLTANGEFYEYKEIRAALRCRGHRLSTKSDSEIALPLYQEQGLSFVDALRGEFAFALFDEERERLLLVRDRFGVKPLHVHIAPDGVYWGSEIKALLAHPAVPRRMSAHATLGQMMNLVPPGRTAFEGIESVEPGHMLVITREGGRFTVRDRTYWDLDFPLERDRPAATDPQAHERAVADALIDAVRVRLEADVPVGCYLSGGIDSCSILGLADAMQQSPVQAFTVGFDDDDYDESAPAREMAKSLGAEQRILTLEADALYGESYVDAVRHAERAFYNPFSVAKWHLSRAVRDAGYRVVVTGEGSDELFGGYPFFKQDLLRHGDAEGELGSVLEDNAVFRGATISEEPRTHPAFETLCGFTPAWLHPWMATLTRARALLSDELRAELADYDPITESATRLDGNMLAGRHALDKAQYTYVKTLMESQVLGWSGDRMDMAHSVEARPAFLDHRLAAVATRVPPMLRIREGVEKWILREAMKHVLPRSLYERQKFAFMAPPSHTDPKKRGAIAALVERYLNPDAIEALGHFDPAKVRELLEQRATTTDAVTAVQNDALLNQLLGIHIVHAELATNTTEPPRPLPPTTEITIGE